MKRTWRFPFAALAVTTLVFGAWEHDAETSVPSPGGEVRIDLAQGDFVVSVVPSLGGRVVGLRAGKGPNLLAWNERYEHGPLPLPSLETPFAPWNGRILWVGPQSAWWSDQDLSPERKEAKPPWPPDPFHEAARYEVVERTPTLLVMKGPVSPITGLEFAETVEIVGPRKVRFVAVATNRRATSVAWDLWPNTRVRPAGWPYVAIAPGSVPRIDAPKGGRAAAYPHRILDGFLTLPPGVRPKAPAQQLHVKVFLQPASGEIAFFLGRQLLRLEADLVPPDELHPEQAFVELYRGAGADPASDILELEMHGPYLRLRPGEQVSFEQTAEVQDYDGTPDPEKHVAFLKTLPGAFESKAILR